MLTIAYVLSSLRLLMLKTEGQKVETELLAKTYKNEFKILANPGFKRNRTQNNPSQWSILPVDGY